MRVMLERKPDDDPERLGEAVAPGCSGIDLTTSERGDGMGKPVDSSNVAALAPV